MSNFILNRLVPGDSFRVAVQKLAGNNKEAIHILEGTFNCINNSDIERFLQKIYSRLDHLKIYETDIVSLARSCGMNAYQFITLFYAVEKGLINQETISALTKANVDMNFRELTVCLKTDDDNFKNFIERI